MMGQDNVGKFPTTHWSLVLAAGRHDTSQSRTALASLCEAYWFPLYTYVRRCVRDVHEAQDLTQAFFVQLLDKHYVADADPRRGRFRAFLLTAFRHFLSHEWEKAKAQKRGGGRLPWSLDLMSGESRYQVESNDQCTPEQLFERQWAITLLNQVITRLQSEFASAGKESQFVQLKEFLVGRSSTTYAEVARQLGQSEAAVKMAVHRLRRRYGQLLRDEIAHTVDNPDDVEDEIRDLFKALSG